MAKLAPSILTADFGRLAEQVQEAEAAGADWLHIDVMDGHFVPNLTMGPIVVQAIRRAISLPLDVHLMVERPETLIPAFVDAGADHISIHAEATAHLHRAIEMIRRADCKVGVALNPATPLAAVEEILAEVDIILIMSVDPGFGGQAFLPGVMDKITRLRKSLEQRGLSHVEIEVDGGVKSDNIRQIVDAGASVLVVGSAVYNQRHSVAENMATLQVASKL
ncbi:MAG: ribulose-phosphate 3-epimerase [Caldilineales bacterium]|nr:ribulose-phosphate 3-epimerase [Caldilineales bacterium]